MIKYRLIGVDKLNAKLKLLAKRAAAEDTKDVYVGYTKNYAIFVHETHPTEAMHNPGQYWKFLETPHRLLANSGEIFRIVAATYKATGSVLKGLIIAGKRIQRESQLIVPVDTGDLKGSAYTDTKVHETENE